MCSPLTMLTMSAGSSLMGGVAANNSAKAQAAQLNAEAAGERDAGQAQAERILRAVRREKGAARAQIAANGTALDEFSLRNEYEIDLAGETDAAMAILTGERRARTSETQARMVRQAGRNSLMAGLLAGAGKAATGWKGTKDPIGDFYLRGSTAMGD